jgi:hypothetical protein
MDGYRLLVNNVLENDHENDGWQEAGLIGRISFNKHYHYLGLSLQ